MQEKNIKIPTIIYSVIAIAAFCLLLAAVLVYVFGSTGGIIGKTAEKFFFPAAIAGKSGFITIKEFNGNLESIKMFYENQDFSDSGLRVDFSTDDGKKRLMVKKKNLLNKMIDNAVIERLANERGIKITEEMISQEVERKTNEYGSRQDLEESMKRLYGWSVEDFMEKIVKPDMYKEKLIEDLRKSDKSNFEAKQKMEVALAKIKEGKDFGETAREFSEGESAKNSGDLGWLSADLMLPELAESAFSMKKGETSEIIESSLGFHIIRIDDERVEDGVGKIKASQVFARAADFPEWLSEQEKNSNIYIPLKEFYWDKNLAAVEFSSRGMKEFEDNLEKNSAGDISVLF